MEVSSMISTYFAPNTTHTLFKVSASLCPPPNTTPNTGHTLFKVSASLCPPPTLFKLSGLGLYRPRRTLTRTTVVAMADDNSRADDMSLDAALKLLGVSESASFDDILRAKNSILSSSNQDPLTIAQVEAAYDMLLMQRLTQRQAGKVVNNSIRYADVKPVNTSSLGTMPQWLQSTIKASSLTVGKPPSSDIGLQVGFYGALMILTYINGMSSPATGPVSGPDVPGFILAASLGASLYFISKKNVKLGKATVITVGGLVAGAVVGSAVENWLQVDIVPFLGLHSPAAVVSEFILVSQLFVSLYLR